MPLKSVEVVTLAGRQSHGLCRGRPPVEEGGPISEREAVTQANIVRYIRARETYDPPALRDNFELASLLSAGQASKDLAEEFSPSNPANPMKLWGATGRTRVYVESVNFLTNGWMQNPGSPATAAVRFMTTRTTGTRKHHRTLGGQCPFPLYENADEKPMAVRQSARLPGRRISQGSGNGRTPSHVSGGGTMKRAWIIGLIAMATASRLAHGGNRAGPGSAGRTHSHGSLSA